MASLIIRKLIFGLIAVFVALTASFFFFGTKYPPLRGTPLVHAYWVWLRGVPNGRSFSQGLLEPHLLSLVGGRVRAHDAAARSPS